MALNKNVHSLSHTKIVFIAMCPPIHTMRRCSKHWGQQRCIKKLSYRRAGRNKAIWQYPTSMASIVCSQVLPLVIHDEVASKQGHLTHKYSPISTGNTPKLGLPLRGVFPNICERASPQLSRAAPLPCLLSPRICPR